MKGALEPGGAGQWKQRQEVSWVEKGIRLCFLDKGTCHGSMGPGAGPELSPASTQDGVYSAEGKDPSRGWDLSKCVSKSDILEGANDHCLGT